MVLCSLACAAAEQVEKAAAGQKDTAGLLALCYLGGEKGALGARKTKSTYGRVCAPGPGYFIPGPPLASFFDFL